MAAHEYIGLESPDFSQFDKDHHGCIIGVVLMVGVFCSPSDLLGFRIGEILQAAQCFVDQQHAASLRSKVKAQAL